MSKRVHNTGFLIEVVYPPTELLRNNENIKTLLRGSVCCNHFLKICISKMECFQNDIIFPKKFFMVKAKKECKH